MVQELHRQSIRVERAKPEDAAEIFSVQRETWLDTYPNEDAGITKEDIRKRLEGAHGELIQQKLDWWKRGIETAGDTRAVFVVRDGDKVVGYTVPSIMDGQCRVGALYVLPEAQGKGLGGKLLEKAIEWHGRDKDIFLHVASYNQNAISFYRRRGFKTTNTEIKDTVAVQNGNKPIPEIEMILKHLS